MKTLIALLTVGLATTGYSQTVEQPELFAANEVNVSLFGTYSNPEKSLKETFNNSARHGDFGAGIGVQYFLSEYFGGQVDVVIPNANDTHGGLFDYASVSAVARYPIGQLAPYGIAGVGHNFSDRAEELNTHAGIGVEYRFNKTIGTFVESRYIWQSSDAPDTLQSRFGVTVRF